MSSTTTGAGAASAASSSFSRVSAVGVVSFRRNTKRQVPSLWTVFLVWCGLILVRICIGYQPHSGQDNYHGSAVAYGGDFEAQRHWMELTWNLPVEQWYTHDLEYWGLDYPPLSAYQSWICGALSHFMVGPHSVALYASRGLEDGITHKPFMRMTVLILDLLIYGSACYVLTKPAAAAADDDDGTSAAGRHSFRSLVGTFGIQVMLQPSILLLDHGHFQYNTVSLGLALWAFYYATKHTNNHPTSSSTDRYSYFNEIWACILFTCALLFKQMTLYYALAIFAYLLGTCFYQKQPPPEQQPPEQQPSEQQPQQPPQPQQKREGQQPHSSSSSCYTLDQSRFWSFGMAVLGTVVLLVGPVVWSFHGGAPEENTTTTTTTLVVFRRLKHMMHRIFPLHRGLFEDKVANLWCALSVKPLRLAHRIPKYIQPYAALLLTLFLSMPALIPLFLLGQEKIKTRRSNDNNNNHNNNTIHHPQQQQPLQDDSSCVVNNNNDNKEEQELFLLGASITALSFFLASFHVHEKSILLVVAPASMAGLPLWFIDWFAMVTTWSLYPLFILDRLQLAYIGMILLYTALRRIWYIISTISISSTSRSVDSLENAKEGARAGKSNTTTTNTTTNTTSTTTTTSTTVSSSSWWFLVSSSWLFSSVVMRKVVVGGSIMIMIGLHLLELSYTPPSHLPDLFPVLWSMAGCGFYVFAWAFMVHQLYQRITPLLLLQQQPPHQLLLSRPKVD